MKPRKTVEVCCYWNDEPDELFYRIVKIGDYDESDDAEDEIFFHLEEDNEIFGNHGDFTIIKEDNEWHCEDEEQCQCFRKDNQNYPFKVRTISKDMFVPEIELSKITKEQLHSAWVFPLDVEKITEDSLNENYPEIILLGEYKYPHGTTLRNTDEGLFRLACIDNQIFNKNEKIWIEVESSFYDIEQIISVFTKEGIRIENDL